MQRKFNDKLSNNKISNNEVIKIEDFFNFQSTSEKIEVSKFCKISKFYSEANKKFFCIKSYNPTFNLIGKNEIYINNIINKNCFLTKRNTLLNYYFSFYSKENLQIENIFMKNTDFMSNNEKIGNKLHKYKNLNLVFEYSSYGNLIDFINLNDNFFTKIKNVKNFLLDMISALKIIHFNGVVHNDLRLENILVFINEKRKIIMKICDFNDSFILNNEKIHFNLEENFYNKFGFIEEPSFKIDYFQLGIVLFQILFFENPLKYLKKIDSKIIGNKMLVSEKKEVSKEFNNSENLFKINVNKPHKSPTDKMDNNISLFFDLSENDDFRILKNKDLKNLIFNLLEINPHKRCDDSNVLENEFFKRSYKIENIKIDIKNSFLLKNMRTKRIVRRLSLL